MGRMLYEKCTVCHGRGCHLCHSSGYVETGITAGQVERLVEAAQRLDIRVNDVVIVRESTAEQLIMFIVTSIKDGKAFGSCDPLGRMFIEAPLSGCRRIGRFDRKEGEPI